jgi:acetyl esterase/lipase
VSLEVLEFQAVLMTIARYRLAPQFPFPCGLHDCLAAYLHLLTVQDATTIILAGDSAGGGMVLRFHWNPS